MVRTRRVIILGIAPVQELDAIGPLNVFTIANEVLKARRTRPRLYQTEVVSGGTSRTITGQSGVGLATRHVFHELRGPIDTLLVTGGLGARSGASSRLLDWLTRRARVVRRLGSVCTGAFVLADAGLLAGCRVTTHWAHASELAHRHPNVTVDSAPIWTHDGNIYTSAGICAGIDLSLALVEEDHGSEIALDVARHLVVYLRRPGDQAQFSVALAGQVADRRAFRDLSIWIIEHLGEDLRIPALAAQVSMSERNFSRAFTREVGMSPGRFIERARYDGARAELARSQDGVQAIAARCGYGSAEVMRRAFLRRGGITPSHYRERFHE